MNDQLLPAAQLCQLMTLKGQDATRAIKEQYTDTINLCRLLKSDPITGLSDDKTDLELRRKLYGDNSSAFLVNPTLHRRGIILHLYFFAMLALFAYLNGKLHSYIMNPLPIHHQFWTPLVGIVLFVKVFKCFGCFQRKTGMISIVRKGKAKLISRERILVGDVIKIFPGVTLPVDAVLLCSVDLTVDESSVFGKPLRKEKGITTDPLIFRGSHVTKGVARVVVTAVGESCWKYRKDANQESSVTKESL